MFVCLFLRYVKSPEEWVSPITSSLITAGTVKLAAVTCGPDGAVRFGKFSSKFVRDAP